jgi:TRAP transporter TAXI family solute receptor
MTVRRNSILCALVVLMLAGTAHAQTVSVMTTPAGSLTNSVGSAIAKVVTEKAKVRMIVQPQATTGFDEVEGGTAEFNVGNGFDATFFATGTGDYEGQGAHKNIRHVATLFPYRVAMHVRANSEIKSIADLKGKRVSSDFNAQKTIGRIISAHLANGGLTYKDVVGVPAPNVVRAGEDFKSGRVDVLFFAVGAAAIKEASAAVGGLRVLPVDDSPEAMKRMQAVVPGSYVQMVNPSPAIDGLTEPTKLVAFDMSMNAYKDVPNSVVYRVAKAIHENKADLVAVFPPFALFIPNDMSKPSAGVEFHPGAMDFYREAGITKP